MTRHALRWVCLLFGGPMTLGAQAKMPGIIVERTSGNNGVQFPWAPIAPAGVTTAIYAGDRMRTNGVGAGGPDSDIDAWSIRRASGRESYLVVPAWRQVFVTSSTALDSMARARGVELTERRGAAERLAAGEPVLGHATTRYRITTHRDVIPWRGQPVVRMDEENTLWIASDTTDPVIAEAIRHVLRFVHAPELPRGIVLRSSTVTRRASGRPAISTMLVTRLERTRVDTMQFVLPTDYVRVTPAARERERRSHIDSMFRAQSAGDSSGAARQEAWLAAHGSRIQRAPPKP